jgi:hypothetical protein
MAKNKLYDTHPISWEKEKEKQCKLAHLKWHQTHMGYQGNSSIS